MVRKRHWTKVVRGITRKDREGYVIRPMPYQLKGRAATNGNLLLEAFFEEEIRYVVRIPRPTFELLDRVLTIFDHMAEELQLARDKGLL